MTGQPKSKDMVERGARSLLQIEGGHHDRETGLRNKSGKALKQGRVGESNPTHYFFFTHNLQGAI